MLNEEDFQDLVEAVRLLTGIIGRHGSAQAAREEFKKKSMRTEKYCISRV